MVSTGYGVTIALFRAFMPVGTVYKRRRVTRRSYSVSVIPWRIWRGTTSHSSTRDRLRETVVGPFCVSFRSFPTLVERGGDRFHPA
jgi:hypothetical protein